MFDNDDDTANLDGNELGTSWIAAYGYLIGFSIISAGFIVLILPIAVLIFPPYKYLLVIFIVPFQIVLSVFAAVIVDSVYLKFSRERGWHKINSGFHTIIPLTFNLLATFGWILLPTFISNFTHTHPALLRATSTPYATATPQPISTPNPASKATSTAQAVAMSTFSAMLTAQPAAIIKDESIIPNDNDKARYQYQAVLHLDNLTPTASWRLHVKLVNYKETIDRTVGNEALYIGPFESTELIINIPIEKDRNAWFCQKSFLTETLYLVYSLDGEAGPKESDDPSMQGYFYGFSNDLPVSSLVKQQIQKLVCEANS